MPFIIHRKDSIKIICKEELKSLTLSDRESILLIR